MKNIFTIAALMFVVFPVNAQKYMRYHMSDSTFHGFYTESIDSMEHTLSHSYVHMGGNTYEIPLDKVDSISFEGISVYDENVIGKYRIYELESDTLPYKKAYIDNRAMMIASRRGEFGANDTIVIASEYYNTKWMIMTNNDGDVEKFFDGKALFYFDYQSEGGFTVLRMADSICTTLELKAEDCNKVKARSSTVNKSLGKFLENIQAIGNKVDEVGGQFGKDHPIWDFAIPNGITEGLGWLTDVIDDVKNNPELHNQQLIVNGLEVTGDLAGICATLLAGIPTEGLAWTLLLSEVGLLATDVGELFEELFPDSDQMKAYKEYYQNKYNIFVRAEEPANITYSGATLKGTLSTSQNKNLGRAYFYFSELCSVDGRDVDANMNPVTNGGWLLEAPITNLKMNTTYLYFIVYECEVDGLNFTFISENSSDFTTHNLSLSDISAEDCYYYDGKVCYDMTATIESTKESLANYKECGVYYRNKKTGKTYIEKKATFSGYSETSEVSFPFYVDKEDFDVINHSLHHARSSNYSFGVYVETQDGYHELYDEQDFDFEYDKEPKVHTCEASFVSQTQATVQCEYEDCLFWDVLRGVEYFTDTESESLMLGANEEDGSHEFPLEDLTPNTTYNYRAYYEVDGIREYGETRSFETKDAVVETGESSSVTAHSAVVSGYAEGLESTETHYELGICYSTSGTPSINNGKFVSSGRTSGGDFTVSLTSLKPRTTYYYATCLVFDGEYFYGETRSFETKDAVVETGESSSVTANSAVVAGYAEGLESAETLCELGVCYSTSGTPSINNGKFVSSGRTSSGDFTVSLTGLKPNTTYYYATCMAIDGEYFYGETKSFETKEPGLCPDHNHPHMIDLGLPSGTKWACCNVGASSPEGYGGYYAWGETEEKSNYSSSNNVTVITDSNDVAFNKSGGEMRMPTLSQIEELKTYCIWTWEVYNGVYGAMVRGGDNAIFLPAAGYKEGYSKKYSGKYGSYWSSTSYSTSCGTELIFGILDGDNNFHQASFYYKYGKTGWKSCGRSVRPVDATK